MSKTFRFKARSRSGSVYTSTVIALLVAFSAAGAFTSLGRGFEEAVAGAATTGAPVTTANPTNGAVVVARPGGPILPLSPAPAVSVQASAETWRLFLDAAEKLVPDATKVVAEIDNEFWVPPSKVRKVALSDVKGIDDILQQVWERGIMPFQRPEVYEGTELVPPKGVLLVGSPGVGKTEIARAVANINSKMGVAFFNVDTSALANDIVNGAARVKALFAAASEQPSFIYLDEFDAIAKARGSGQPSEATLTALLTAMDGMEETNQTVIFASTNLSGVLDEAIKRPGRFDLEIEVPVPNKEGRAALFDLFTRAEMVRIDVPFDELVEKTEGFTGADIRGLVQDTRLRALRRTDYAERAELTPEDFMSALEDFDPTVKRTDLAEATPVRWEDVGGLGDQIERLVNGIDQPWRNPERFIAVGEKPTPLNFLMFGPPGTGKTMLAQAAATEIEAPVFIIRGSDVRTMWYGESARNLRKILDKAKRGERAIVYFDEPESIFPIRGTSIGNNENETVVTELLQFMDGAQKNPNVSFIFGTNEPQLMDSAILSRVDEYLYVPAPDLIGRREILDTHLRGRKLAVDDEIAFRNELAQRMNGFTGRDIQRLVKKAARRAISHGPPDQLGISRADFDWALGNARPSVNAETNLKYERMLEEFQNLDR